LQQTSTSPAPRQFGNLKLRHAANSSCGLLFTGGASLLIILSGDKGIANRAHYLCTPEAR
jgi:hypothetical protein